MGPIEAKRILLNELAIPARSSAAFDNDLAISLLVAGETVDEEKISDGTNVAETKSYSKLVSLKGNFTVHGMTANQVIRWMLVKQPDGEDIVGNLTDSVFHHSTDSQGLRELRGNILAKGYVVASDRLSFKLGLFARRNTIRRLGNLRENDKIVLHLAVSDANAAKITGFGTLYVRLT